MRLIVFSESNAIRKKVEDLLTSTPHDFQSLSLSEILVKGAVKNCDGLILDWDSWQRCTVLLKYFGVLDDINARPLVCLVLSKSINQMKYRSSKVYTAFCPMPSHTEDLHGYLQEMSANLVPA